MVCLNLATWILVGELLLPCTVVEGLVFRLKTSTKSLRSRERCILSRIPAVSTRDLRRQSSKKDLDEDVEDFKITDPKFIERNKRWVLIVDDEEAIRMAVGAYLYDQGYQVTACADADSLLETCTKPNSDGDLLVAPDVIIRSVGSSHCS
jgi:PleD family two-component response regulator